MNSSICPDASPHPWMHEDRSVQSLDVIALVDHSGPPCLLDVAFELDPKRTVVPHRTGPPVNLGRLEDEAAPFGEGNEGIERVEVGHARPAREDENGRGWKQGRKVAAVGEARLPGLRP